MHHSIAAPGACHVLIDAAACHETQLRSLHPITSKSECRSGGQAGAHLSSGPHPQTPRPARDTSGWTAPVGFERAQYFRASATPRTPATFPADQRAGLWRVKRCLPAHLKRRRGRCCTQQQGSTGRGTLQPEWNCGPPSVGRCTPPAAAPPSTWQWHTPPPPSFRLRRGKFQQMHLVGKSQQLHTPPPPSCRLQREGGVGLTLLKAFADKNSGSWWPLERQTYSATAVAPAATETQRGAHAHACGACFTTGALHTYTRPHSVACNQTNRQLA